MLRKRYVSRKVTSESTTEYISAHQVKKKFKEENLNVLMSQVLKRLLCGILATESLWKINKKTRQLSFWPTGQNINILD